MNNNRKKTKRGLRKKNRRRSHKGGNQQKLSPVIDHGVTPEKLEMGLVKKQIQMDSVVDSGKKNESTETPGFFKRITDAVSTIMPSGQDTKTQDSKSKKEKITEKQYLINLKKEINKLIDARIKNL